MGRVNDSAVRGAIVEANDGIVATAGVLEGFAGAGITGSTMVLAGVSAMIAGAVAVGGAKYGEVAQEQDALIALLEEERRQLELSPEEESAELARIYEAKGLSADLANQVAAELTRTDALAAHAEAEHGVSLDAAEQSPLREALIAGGAAAAGSAIPLVAVIVTPDSWRAGVTFVAVVFALALTSVVAAWAGRTSLRRTLARTIGIGVIAMVAAWMAGQAFD